MFDQRLWNTHIHLREQQFIQEAENDRLADEYRKTKTHGVRNPLFVALADALAIFRRRIATATSAGTQPVEAQAPMASEKAVSILAEAEEVVRAYAGSSSDSSCCPC